jgi:hypothetical protein
MYCKNFLVKINAERKAETGGRGAVVESVRALVGQY